MPARACACDCAYAEDSCNSCAHSFDAVVVGSGYGGAVAACRLAQAGLRVCLMERGRQFDPHQFPRSITQLLLDTAFHTARHSIGRHDALYQIHMQGDSVAVVACGLGGGSLVNAGLLMPTPKRARRDPRWPTEWEKDWQVSESKARAMLDPQSVPFEYPSSKVMDAISDEIEDCVKDPLHLTVKMKASVDQFGVPQNSCIACGNCLTGCPYNAKNSTDKNYVAAALQAGAHVRTECEVRFVLRNCTTENPEDLDTICQAKHDEREMRKGRRWRVYLNDVDFLLADYVVLSGGALGTTGILLRSRERGLELSSKLGCSFSTNGNNTAVVAGCRAPTKAYGLAEQEFSNIPIPLRPGPSISASFTSSLGFTIQGAVLPLAIPNLLFKGVFTYQWEGCGYGLLRGMWEKMKQWMKTRDCEALVLNMIGMDAADGRVELDSKTGRLRILAPHDPMLSKKMLTFHKLSKRLGGTLFMSRYRSTSVHLLGACPAAYDADHGVVNPNGQVFKYHHHHDQCNISKAASRHFSGDDFLPSMAANVNTLSTPPSPCKKHALPSAISNDHVHAGLYACDASIIPCPIGINPSLTIAILAEHISNHIVCDALEYLNSEKQETGHERSSPRAKLDPLSYNDQAHSNYPDNNQKLDIIKHYKSQKSVVEENKPKLIKESTTQNGKTNSPIPRYQFPCSNAIDDATAIVRETMHGYLDGMPCTLHLVMHMGGSHYLHIKGSNPKSHPLLRGRVGGHVVMKTLDPYPMYIVSGQVDMCSIDRRTPYTQYMRYDLQLASKSGARYTLQGVKEMRPFLLGWSLWKESTTLHVSLQQTNPAFTQRLTDHKVSFAPFHGSLHVSLAGLCQSLCTMKGSQPMGFVKCLAKSLMETYFTGRQGQPSNVDEGAVKAIKYPVYHVIHSMTTEDGFEISCVQCAAREKSRSSVLLLNGYSTESFWLPTEEHDLVRALLQQGHEVWLLKGRLHPDHATTHPFNLDDLAKFDLPAAFMKMREVRGDMDKVHVVAHCVGGLAIHMAILGGFVPTSSIASLTCTNSGMFFRVSPLTRIKLWLPLIPISMALMGGNPLLQLIAKDNLVKHGWRHALLKQIARAIPRREKCICNECEVFAGVFGNTFWHDKVRPEMHEWLNKENVHCLPMQAFTQLRQICNAGTLVSADGQDMYLPFIERLAVPTTYVSGGRPILVLPSTSEHSHAFMQLHHPHLPHKRFVIPGYGHSDLLIGEFSHRDVFPHILHSISHSETKEQPSSNIQTQTTITWNNYTFQPNSIFYSYLTFSTLSLIIPLTYFLFCVQLI